MTYLRTLLQIKNPVISTLVNDKAGGKQDKEVTARNLAGFLLTVLPTEFKKCLGCPKSLNMEMVDQFYNEEEEEEAVNCKNCEDITCSQFLSWIHSNYNDEYTELVDYAKSKEYVAYE